jgi:malic enzyme
MVVVAKDIKRLLAEAGVDEASLQVHKRLAGKIGVTPKVELTEETLELLYTPGIGAVSRRLGGDPHDARDLTWKGNAVAVVSDGSAVLGLGDEGPVAAMPVLEGKALLFRALAVVATGRSDHPNQVNNVLAFPGLFRGALDARLSEIDEKALLRAAHALAGLVESPTADSILPGVLDERVVPAVAAAVPESSRPR